MKPNAIASRLSMVLALSLFLTALPAAKAYYIMGVTDRMVGFPAYVAQNKGFWKEQGLDIRVSMVADREDLFTIMRARFNLTGRHSIDLAVCRAGDAAYEAAAGLAITPIADVAEDRSYTYLVLRKELATVKDLRGKAVACDAQGANLLFLAEVLKSTGLTLDDVTLLDQYGQNNTKAFREDKAQAIVINATGSAECTSNGLGRVTAKAADASAIMRDVIVAKSFLLKQDPALAAKVVAGFAKAQQWMQDPTNNAELLEMVNRQYRFVTYQEDAPKLGMDFVKQGLDGFQLVAPVALTEEPVAYRNAQTFFKNWTRSLLEGARRLGSDRPAGIVTGTALDNALGWWRFESPTDFLNRGKAGAQLDLRATGAETNATLYGIIANDYFHSRPIGSFGGYMNDSYGWATDGATKCLLTRGVLDVKGSFTVWLRCSNRNTRDTWLASVGQDSNTTADITTGLHNSSSRTPRGGTRPTENNQNCSAEGGSASGGRPVSNLLDIGITGRGTNESNEVPVVAIVYNRGPQEPSIALVAGKDRILSLEHLPVGAFLDVCFSYDAEKRLLRGWVFETEKGKLIAEGQCEVEAASMTGLRGRLTIGGSGENAATTLHGSVENVAVWNRALASAEAAQLTAGPDRAAPAGSGVSSWHNVRDYGAVGDGKADDTDAIQSAINACIVPIGEDQSPDAPPRPGFRSEGLVFIPKGTYRTTRPLIMQQGITVMGDRVTRPRIVSEADAAIVWWNGAWNDRPIDFKARNSIQRLCPGTILENLWVVGKRFGGHTMGVGASGMRMKNCRWEGAEAGFVATGFLMFSEIKDSQFHQSLWIIPRDGGARFNTAIVENIVVGLQGTRWDKYAIRLEGCIQCVRLSEIVFEARGKGIYLDAFAAGVTIDIANVWNYDTAGECEALRIENGQGISVRNMMATDHPSTIFVGKNARNIRLENIYAKSITFEDAKATKPVLCNISCPVTGEAGSLIEDDMGGTKEPVK